MPATIGDDILTGTPGNDTIDGLAGNDTITGLAGNDTLIGNTGNDTINAGTGTDTVSGGADTDRLIVDYSANNSGVGIVSSNFAGTLAAGYSGTYSVSGFSSVAFTGIENFTVTGTSFGDNVTTGDGNDIVNLGDGSDVAILGKGTDSADGGGGIDGVGKDFSAYASGVALDLVANTSVAPGGSFLNFEYFSGITGSAFNDSFLGTAANNADTVAGGAGNDTASFLRGTDSFDGGTGTDRLIIDYSTNNSGAGIVTTGFAGTLASGYGGTYSVSGWGSTAFAGTENFTITGTSFVDSVTTGDGNDIVNLGDGSDVAILGKGTDSANGGGGIDGVGKDFSAYASGVALDLVGNTSVAPGGSFLNFEYFSGIVGSGFDDSFLGTAANNADTVAGGNGSDTASFLRGTDSFDGGAGTDRLIVDYSANNSGAGIVTTGFAGNLGSGYSGTYTVSGWGSTAFTTVENFTVTGTSFGDNVTTGDGNDIVNLGDGNDVAILGKGTDSADGGGGIDGVGKDFSACASGVALDLVGNTSVAPGGSFLNFEYFSGIVGSGFDDSFLGTAANNADSVAGGAGNDTASFLRGTDSFDGGAGTDRLIVDYSANNSGAGIVTTGFGTDGSNSTFKGTYAVSGWGSTAFTTAENFTITGTSFVDSVTTGDGNDIVNLGNGNDTVTLGKGTDSADGGGGIDGVGKDFSVFGAAVSIDLAADTSFNSSGTIGGFEYFTTIKGSKYGDVFLGTTAAGNETIISGAGDDTASFLRGTDSFTAGTGNDRLIIDYSANNSGAGVVSSISVDPAGGTQGTYSVSGWGSLDFTGVENMSITGTSFSDTITTGGGNDFLDGGFGNNTLTGGAGDDIYVVRSASDVITELATGGSDAIMSSLQTSYAASTIANIEGYIYTGAASFTGTGDGGANTFGGGSGNDSLSGAGGIDKATYLSSTVGVTASLALQGAAQNTVGAGSDTLSGFENLEGSNFADILSGDAGNNRLFGLAGNDTIAGGAGDDLIDGGIGIDTVSYASATSLVKVSLAKLVAQPTTGAGNDTLLSIENVIGSGFNDVLTGDSGTNTLDGGNGNDKISGGKGTDTLIGGGGNDALTGGTEADALLGGTGADKFIFKTLADSRALARDVISDFSSAEGDKIDLSAIDGDLGTVGNQAFTYIGSAAFSGAGQVRTEFLGPDTAVFVDQDGDGVADMSFLVTGNIAFGGTDFIL